MLEKHRGIIDSRNPTRRTRLGLLVMPTSYRAWGKASLSPVSLFGLSALTQLPGSGGSAIYVHSPHPMEEGLCRPWLASLFFPDLITNPCHLGNHSPRFVRSRQRQGMQSHPSKARHAAPKMGLSASQGTGSGRATHNA